MLDMFSFCGKSKNFKKLQKLLEQSEEKADKFFDALPEQEQVRLWNEVQNYLADQRMQEFVTQIRKATEATQPFIGFSGN